MGYNTIFDGILKFKSDVTASQLNYLSKYLGEDCRDHPEWKTLLENYYVDLMISEDFSGLEHNGSEKTYNLAEVVNFIINEMRKKYPDFELEGEILAQGEEIGDIWKLVIIGGRAVEVETPPAGEKIKCPHCECYFYYEK